MSAAATAYFLLPKRDSDDMGDYLDELASLGELKIVKENGVEII